MTQKELLYFEDAVGHETNIISIIEESINYLNDDNLISFMKNELRKHKNTKEKIMYILEDKSHE